jgi:hypothetical protein
MLRTTITEERRAPARSFTLLRRSMVTPLHSVAAPTTQPASEGPSRPDPRRQFLGAELSPEPTRGGWLVRAVLGNGPLFELLDDGVLPARATGLLPLRHGVAATGAPATCLLGTSGLARLRSGVTGDAGAAEVECAACRAWQMTHGAAPARAGSKAMLARLRAALGDVLSHAA